MAVSAILIGWLFSQNEWMNEGKKEFKWNKYEVDK